MTNIITNNNINTFIINDPNIAANTAGNPAALQGLTQAALNGATPNQTTTTTTVVQAQGPSTSNIHPSQIQQPNINNANSNASVSNPKQHPAFGNY